MGGVRQYIWYPLSQSSQNRSWSWNSTIRRGLQASGHINVCKRTDCTAVHLHLNEGHAGRETWECMNRPLNSHHSQMCHRHCSTCIQCIASDMFLPLPSSLLWTAGKKDGLRKEDIMAKILQGAEVMGIITRTHKPKCVTVTVCWNKRLRGCFCRAFTWLDESVMPYRSVHSQSRKPAPQTGPSSGSCWSHPGRNHSNHLVVPNH